ncbi:MAG: stage II sporulation protein M [Flavobacteriaceae bacterium]|nr:stage II sporulation protein M [Flavobacteriaceae bacterium]
MKNKCIAFAFFLLGIVLFIISKDTSQLPITTDNSEIKISFYESMEAFQGYEFIGIFLHNIVVGILLSIIGYFSGGFLTSIVLIWNGFLVALVYNIGIYQLPLDTILYASKHVPFEVYAFLVFADFGLQGRFFITKILKHNEIDFSLIPNYRKLLFPTVLLVISAFLETI